MFSHSLRNLGTKPWHQCPHLCERMHKDDCVYPSRHALLSLLKVCAKSKDLQRGFKVHANIAQMGLQDMDPIIGSALVDMYAKCRVLSRARQAFDKSLVRDVVLWTTLMAGYVENGEAAEALKCLEQMQVEGVFPDEVTFVCSLKACTNTGATDKGQEIHDEIERRGLLRENYFLGSTLVDMYAKCGSLGKAQQVFDRLPNRDIVSWNALIQGFAVQGHGEEALGFFEKMQHEGVSPDAVTFACSLKACSSLKVIEKGLEIHVEIERKGLLEKDMVLGNSLVDMYVKCGSLSKAQHVLEKLPVRDVVSWTALISGYAEHGCVEEALDCFKQMRFEGVPPNAVTFLCSLKACSSIGAADEGREIHAEIERNGLLEQDFVISNALLDMYIKCGLLAQAQQVFDKLSQQSVVSWNTIITGYADHGYGHEAIKFFKQMQSEGFFPDAVTFACILNSCGNTRDVNKGQEIHAQIERTGLLERDLFVCSTLVDMYAKFGLLEKAQQVFDKLKTRDLVAWNALITGYSDHGCGEEALECFERMQAECISPNAITFVCSLKACGIVGASDMGRQIHAEIARIGILERDLLVGNTLVDMYAKCGSLAIAHEVSCRLPVRDVATWNSLMAGYTHLGESLSVFHLYGRMMGEGIEPDSITFLIALNACGRTGFFNKSETCFETMTKVYGIVPTIKHHSCIVNLFGRAGQLDKAIAMAKRMSPYSNLVAWHTLLGACQNLGNIKLGKQAFEHVVSLDDQDASAYVSVSC